MKGMNRRTRMYQIFIDFFEHLMNESQAESGQILIFLKSGHMIGGFSKWSDVIRKSVHLF